ncbi:MAG: hypothetical protein E7K14_01905 [Bacillota bacterium]|nr:hypothetical protein [Bacillota bacterium]
MGTRGLYGIRKDGVDKVTYNHFDSYPEYLGMNMIKFCMNHNKDALTGLFNKIELVGDENPTEEQKVNCKRNGWFDDTVSLQTDDDWYCLLRDTQGNLECLMQADKAYMLDNSDFIKDSLSCEYAYIINLDRSVLEVWIGCQKEPDPKNRYGTQQDDYGYYPCKLIRSYHLPLTKNKKWYLKDMNKNIKKRWKN